MTSWFMRAKRGRNLSLPPWLIPEVSHMPYGVYQRRSKENGWHLPHPQHRQPREPDLHAPGGRVRSFSSMATSYTGARARGFAAAGPAPG